MLVGFLAWHCLQKCSDECSATCLDADDEEMTPAGLWLTGGYKWALEDLNL
jgi:hypothetical protein